MKSNTLSKGVYWCMVLAVFSCTPKKQLTSGSGAERHLTKSERNNVLQHVAQNRVYFTTFNGRAKSKIAVNNDSHDVTANVRVERDKAIWISITAIMGLEVARVLITPDSIKIINRLQSEYINRPFDYIHRFASQELDFSSLQNLLMGNVIEQATSRHTEVTVLDESNVLRGQSKDLLYHIQLNEYYRTTSTMLDEEDRSQRLEAWYGNYNRFMGQLFPQNIKLSIAAEGLLLQSEMNYSRVAYDEVIEMPFSIPAKYKEVQ